MDDAVYVREGCDVPAHPPLRAYIDTAPDTCTSVIVDLNWNARLHLDPRGADQALRVVTDRGRYAGLFDYDDPTRPFGR
ncbi:hypothetical protein CFB89_31660 [Burkholderia sp. AU16741]|uniref:hypothetical protein n=1 Tax=Burkholderia sp. AU16741 TaxID=2015347 RepID=UPI000B79BB7E|nr:hypothetical protein [Burkholderia sp. AU16741]OXI28767.1 hypothetical protein CFB89_31660 [Burkholderia sp. AU16741]